MGEITEASGYAKHMLHFFSDVHQGASVFITEQALQMQWKESGTSVDSLVLLSGLAQVYNWAYFLLHQGYSHRLIQQLLMYTFNLQTLYGWLFANKSFCFI